MMLEVNRKRPREYSNTWSHDHTGVFNGAATSQSQQQQQQQQQQQISQPQIDEDDIIVLDSDEGSDDVFGDDSFAIGNEDSMEDDDNDSDVIVLEEKKLDTLGYEQELSRHLNASFFDASYSPVPQQHHIQTLHRPSLPFGASHQQLPPFKKPRTKSLPQLPHSRISYHPPPNLHRMLDTKVGEIKTNVVPFNELNYTFGLQGNQNINRRMSFAGQTASSSAASSSLINSSANRQSKHSKAERSPSCDDPDGHHIVNAGDSFANGRFKIKKLLGQGTFGKVVSAFDSQANEVVAIKIIRAVHKYRQASKIELRVLSTIKKHDPHNQNHCIHLRECFDYRNHICIVTDLLKISLYDFLEKNSFKPFPGSHIQAISKQLIRSVAFLHDLKLIHTDLKPENILLHDESYVRKPYKSPSASTNNNGKKPMTMRVLKDPLIQIIDFGSAIFEDEYHSPVVSTRHYRAPEIVLNVGWSFPCDMWSVGCILVELATGEALFRTHENLEHLAMMPKIIGKPMDPNMVSTCIRVNYNEADDANNVINCFNQATGELLFPQKASSKKSVKTVESLCSLDEMISKRVGLQINTELSLQENYIINENASSNSKYRGFVNSLHRSSSSGDRSRVFIDDLENDEDDEDDDFDEDDNDLDRDVLKFWYNFIDLVKGCLTYNPNTRLKAIDALEHPWFDLGIYDQGTLEK